MKVTEYLKLRTPRDMMVAGLTFEAAVLPFSFAASQWGIALAFAGWVWVCVRERKLHLSIGPLSIPVGIYLAICFVSSALAERAPHALASVVDNEWLLLNVVIFSAMRPDERLMRRFLSMLVFGFAAIGVYGLIQHVTGVTFALHYDLFHAYESPEFTTYRPSGFFGHALSYAADVLIVFLLALGAGLRGERPGGSAWWRAALIVLGLALVATYSRGMWMAAFVGCGAIFLLVRGLRMRAAIIAACAVTMLTLALSPITRTRASRLGENENADRIEYWNAAWRMFLDHPALGIGADNWDLYFPRYRPTNTLATMKNPDHPHSEYFNVLSSFGLPGFLAYAAIWIVVMLGLIRTAWRDADGFRRALAAGAIAAFAGMLVAQVSQDVYHDFTNQLLITFLLGLTLPLLSPSRASREQ